MGRAPGIALVLHPRRDPGPVLDAVGAWATSHGSRLLMRPADAARWNDAVVVAPLAPLAGISRPMVTAADEPIRPVLEEGSGLPAIEVDGTMLRRMEPGEAIDVRLQLGCGHVVRLDSDRHQRRNQVKLSLLDLPFLPDELRELSPPGSLPGSTRPAPALEP